MITLSLLFKKHKCIIIYEFYSSQPATIATHRQDCCDMPHYLANLTHKAISHMCEFFLFYFLAQETRVNREISRRFSLKHNQVLVCRGKKSASANYLNVCSAECQK